MSEYLDGYPGIAEPLPRIYVKFRLDGLDTVSLGLIDTGGHFCILNRELAAANVVAGQSLDSMHLMTAQGRIQGRLFKHDVELVADEGENLVVESTVFLSSDWRGPNILGYTGVLDRMSFAVLPPGNGFYFGPLG